jgi:hypothetical protein
VQYWQIELSMHELHWIDSMQGMCLKVVTRLLEHLLEVVLTKGISDNSYTNNSCWWSRIMMIVRVCIIDGLYSIMSCRLANNIPIELSAIEGISSELENDLADRATEAGLVHDLAVGRNALGWIDSLGANLALFRARRLLLELDWTSTKLQNQQQQQQRRLVCVCTCTTTATRHTTDLKSELSSIVSLTRVMMTSMFSKSQ